MRASIACVRCRASKVRCINNGVGTICKACQRAKRECTYAQSSFGLQKSHKKDIDTDAEGGASNSESRPRPRKRAHSSGRDGSSKTYKSTSTALEHRILTAAVWLELFDIFQLHYSADFPFLHATTFTKPLLKASSSNESAHRIARPPGSDGFLLAFLALTSRYHAGLIALHTPRGCEQDPLLAARYYATAAEDQLASYCRADWGNLDQLQGLLMLGLNEFGMCKGRLAWTHIGVALRTAQAMGLQYQADLDDTPQFRGRAPENDADTARATPSSNTSEATVEQDRFIQQEIRRRTFWSCFILDRFFSSGKYRPQMIYVKELRIQLPASERAFVFEEKVQTFMLHEDESAFKHRMEKSGRSINNAIDVRIESGPDEGLTSRYVRMVELFGEVAKWSCAGGRRNEEHPPWHQRSRFHSLLQSCRDFKNALPRQHVLSAQNTKAHINMKTSTAYVLMHSMYLLCQVMLHREYVPFVPLACRQPVGPLDPPLFTRDKYDVPPDFWAQSAEECFRSAREIVDLAMMCREWNAMVETPFMGFALYITGFVGVYCHAFPWMDPSGHMCDIPGATNTKGYEAGERAQEMVKQMSSRLRMASGWCQALVRMRKHFSRRLAASTEPIRRMSLSGAPTAARATPTRKRGVSGGLEEYKKIEHILEFGQLQDGDLPQLELMTSRESTSQAEEAVTPGTADMVNGRQPRLQHAGSSAGSDVLDSNTEQLLPSEATSPYSTEQHTTPLVQTTGIPPAHYSGTFKVPQLPRDKISESSSTSPTVYTPSSMSSQPSPGQAYGHFHGWPSYHQMPQNVMPMTGLQPSMQQQPALISAQVGTTYESFPGHGAIHPPPGQYMPYQMPTTVGQRWTLPGTRPIEYFGVETIGVGGDDIAAFVQGENMVEVAERENMAAARGQFPPGWLGVIGDPAYL